MSNNDSVAQWDQFLDYASAGRTIEAIKLLRAHAGIGLKEAKDLYDEFRNTGDVKRIRELFPMNGSVPAAQIAFENGTVTFMPSTREIKIDGIFTSHEWKKIVRIVATIDEEWADKK